MNDNIEKNATTENQIDKHTMLKQVAKIIFDNKLSVIEAEELFRCTLTYLRKFPISYPDDFE